MLFRRKVGYGVNGIALLEALRPKRDLPIGESAIAQAAIRSGERCPAATRGVEPASGRHSLGGRFDTEARSAGVGGTSAHAPMRPGHVIAIGQPLLPVAPLIGAGVKQ